MGPLEGIRVVELAGLAPAPFGAMILADLGAEVIRVERATPNERGITPPPQPLDRGKQSVSVDLKDPGQRDQVIALAGAADVFVEGFRPGVTERLGIGPDVLLAANPRLIYGRLTGWGQTGPLAATAGHDINYIAVGGALEPIGPANGKPIPPWNLLADFAGGGMLLAIGVLSALVERERSGRGQVIDTAMVDGAALLTTFLHGIRANDLIPGSRGTNALDGGAPFYTTYECSDGRYVAVGCVELPFYLALLDGLGITGAEAEELPFHLDRSGWPDLTRHLAAKFRQRTRDEWEQIFAGTDACVSPVLALDEVAEHPYNTARDAYLELAGVTQPAPAPRFSRTPAGPPADQVATGIGEVLARWRGDRR